MTVLHYKRILNYDLAAMNSLLIVLLLENCIQSGLLRSNSGYDALFKASTMEVQIVDSKNQVCYASEQHPIDPRDKRQQSAPISNGQVFWQEDITEINHYMEELEKTGKQLEEENDLIQVELALQEKKLRIAEKNRLYDQIAREVSPQLEKMERLQKESSKEGETREKLILICILSAYIKRRSNLMLMREKYSRIDAKELELCLRESMDNLRLAGILCSLDSVCEGKTEAAALMAAYDLMEQVFEQTFGAVGAFLIRLRISGSQIFLRIQTDFDGELSLEKKSDWASLGGCVRQERMEDMLQIELHLAEEGGIAL